jgi:DNA polymerase-3 subunit beta
VESCGRDGASSGRREQAQQAAVHNSQHQPPSSLIKQPVEEEGPHVKFRCERDVLADALATAGRAATGRTGSLPVLSGVRIDLHGDELRVTGTDLELTIQVAVTVSGDSDGATVLPARLAADIVRSLEAGAVTVEADQDDARISAGRSQFAVRPLSLDDFPRLPDAAADAVTLPSATFGEALRQVARAASGDESRPILTGVLLAAENDGLRLVATDSYRLAVRDLPGTSVLRTDQKVLVPSRALNELARLLPSSGELTLRLGERDATFEVGGARLSTRLIEGEFPNYRQLIPQQYPNRLTVGREPLLDAVRRVKLLARDSTPIRLSMSTDALDLTATTQDIGQAAESLDAKYEGAEMVVAFNPDYLSAGVDAVTADEVVLETLDAMKPAVLRAGEANDFLYLLMPVRVP